MMNGQNTNELDRMTREKLLSIARCRDCYLCTENGGQYAYDSEYVCEGREPAEPIHNPDSIPTFICPLADANIFQMVDGWIVDYFSGASSDPKEVLSAIQSIIPSENILYTGEFLWEEFWRDRDNDRRERMDRVQP